MGTYGVPVPGPSTPPPRTPDALLEDLDPEQRQVATALSGPVAVIAGAGTGKTRAITYRIAYGVACGAYNPTSVLAVTFTTRAAGELRGRLRHLGAPASRPERSTRPRSGRLSTSGPRSMAVSCRRCWITECPMVAEAASRLRVRVDTPGLRDLVAEISWAKVSNVSAEDYPRLAARAQSQTRLLRL